uniref:HMG box domain-containing protein n=1 Tax=Anopheles farauti TaxID=69004 RepID=A0A182QTZ3_9DIPT
MLESALSNVDTYISSIDKPIEGNNNDCNNHNNNNYCYANRNEYTDGLANGESNAGGSVESEFHQEEKQTRSESKRTMNAFLMFCKRHRALVRQHFPSKENRSITKILGSWWGQLEPAKKKTYEMIAQEYRTKVKVPNPNQWSEQQEKTKTATPALVNDDHVQTKAVVRQWSTMVVKQEVPDDIKGVVGLKSSALAKQEVPDDIKDDMVSREAAESLVQLSQGTPLRMSSISMGKLANVNEMGSLSELCTGMKETRVESVGPSFRATNNATEHNYSARQNNDDGALIKQEPEPSQQHRSAESRPTMGTPVNGFNVPVATEPPGCDGQGSNVMTQGTSGRATRSCKAKRYKEFMTNQYGGGTASASSARKSSKKRTSATVTSGSQNNKHNGHAYRAKNNKFYNTSQPVTTTATVPVDSAAAPVDVEALRREIHHKIAKLPCEDFQAFLSSKNMEKRRKKPYVPTVSQQQPEVPIRPTAATSTKIVGCRKRKAPKENITRNPEPTVLERQAEIEPVPRPAYVWPEMGHVTSS